MSGEERQPWERQPGERALWFGRFAIYRDLGPNRTIMDAWRTENNLQQKTPTAKQPNRRWYEVRDEWHWEERAAAYDEYLDQQRLLARQEEIRLQREAEAAAREESRKQRRQILTGFLGKLAQTLGAYHVEGANLSELTRATQMVVEQLRAEYNDLPTQRFGFESEDELDAAIQAEFERILGPDQGVLGAAGGLAPVADGAEGQAPATPAEDAGDDGGEPGGDESTDLL